MKQRKIDLVLCLACSLLLSGCATTVNLTVINSTDSPLNASIVQWDDNQMRIPKDLSLGRIEKNKQSTLSFEMDQGGAFEVIGSANDVEVATSGKISVTRKPDPLNKSVNLNLNNGIRGLDDSTSFEQMSNSFKKLGADYGTTPLPLKTALATVIGSVIVAKKATKDTPGEVFYTVPPNILGVKILKVDDIDDNKSNEKSETIISGTTANNLGGQYGVIAGFGAAFQANKIYELKWTLKGFGRIQKAEDANKDPATMFRNLNSDTLNQIKSALKNNQGAKIYYINQFYVLDSAELLIKEAQKVSGKVELKATVVSGDSIYSFENAQEQNKSYGPVVLSYWGNEFDLIEITNPKVNVTTITGEPVVSTRTAPALKPTMDSQGFSSYPTKIRYRNTIE